MDFIKQAASNAGDSFADQGLGILGYTDKAIIRIWKIAPGNQNAVAKVPKLERTEKTFKVQYNPSSLRIGSTAGRYQNITEGADGMARAELIDNPAQTTFHVTLVFEKVNPADAFMFEKVTNMSAGNLVSQGASLVNNITGDGYSIQKYAEGLLAIVLSQNRYISFEWNKMSFLGELVSVEARYTMFNPVGNPIRCEVALSIQRRQASVDEDEKYWRDRFNQVFGESQTEDGDTIDTDVDAGRTREYLSNLINL